MSGSVLSCSNVTVRRKGFSISGISTTLHSGDIMGLVGRSGSGKSTFISTLIGELRPSLGSIQFIKDTKKCTIRTHVGYSPQDNALYPFLTVRENIKLFARLKNVKRKVVRKRQKQLLTDLRLEKSKGKLITELSGGMRKRADLACALIHDPDIIILDEPFNGLDISLQKFLWTYIRQLAQEDKIVIISSHILSDIEKNCTSLGLIHNNQFFDTADVKKKAKKHKSITAYLAEVFAQ